MMFIAFLLFSSPCFARLYIDYSQSPAPERPILGAALITVPAAADQAEALGYSSKDIAIRIHAALFPAQNEESLKEAMESASRRGRYMIMLDLRGVNPNIKVALKQAAPAAARAAKLKHYFIVENPPLTLPKDAAGQDLMLFRLAEKLASNEDEVIDASVPRFAYTAELLSRILNPKIKTELLSWAQGRAFAFPDAVLVYNEGGLGICSLPKDLFKKEGRLPSKSEAGSMVLWQEGDHYKMLLMPQSAGFWRIK